MTRIAACVLPEKHPQKPNILFIARVAKTQSQHNLLYVSVSPDFHMEIDCIPFVRSVGCATERVLGDERATNVSVGDPLSWKETSRA